METTEPATSGTLRFGALLKRYRLAAGLTQEELAERAHLSVRGITDLERGVRQVPRKDTVALLLEALALGPAERAAFEAAARRPLPSAAPLPHTGPAADVPPVRAPVSGGFLGAVPAGPLVGREPEERRLLATLDAVAGGQGQLLLLAGEPGVGKTRLAQELMLRCQERGFGALTGRCEEHAAALPFSPFVEVLTAAWQTASPALRRHAADRFAELGRILPLLPAPHSAVPETRPRLVQAVAGFLQALAAEGPLALLLDDMHWADSASLELLVHLARSLRGSPVLLLGTYRDDELDADHPLAHAIVTLTRDRLLEILTVRALPPAGTAALIRARFGVEEVSAELRDLIHARTDGNPFFTEEVLSALVEQGAIFQTGAGWERKAVAEIAVPSSIRSVVGQRVGRLAPQGQDLLRLASVLGQEFELAVLLGATELDEGRVLEHLDAALSARLLEERQGGRDERYGFVHALIGQALYQAVPRHRLRRLHRQAGDTLERLHGERPDVWVELARHFLAAGDEARARRYAELAGDHAVGLYAHAEAIRHYELALALATEAGDESSATQVREKLGIELRTVGRGEAALAVLERAAQWWQEAGNLEGLGRVTAEIAWVYALTGPSQEGVRRLQEVLPRLEERGPTVALLALYSALGFHQFMSGRYTEQLMVAERIADLARRLHDSEGLVRAEVLRAEALQLLGRVGEALRVAEETMALSQAAGAFQEMAASLAMKTYIHMFRGEFDSAGSASHQSITNDERLGDASFISAFETTPRRMLYLVRGDWVQARTSAELAVAAAGQYDETFLATYALLTLGMLCLQEGVWDEAARHLELASAQAARSDDLQGLRWAARSLAELDVLHGRPAAAVSRLLPLLDRAGLEEFDVTAFLPVLAWAYLELDDLVLAEQTIDQALRRSRAEQLRLLLLDALRVQAMLLARQGRPTEARKALEEGLALARAMPCPYAEGRLLQVYGQLHAALGDGRAAEECLAAAQRVFQRLGARMDLEQTERLLAVNGPRRK